MPTATVTSKGQVTIPKQIRELLKVKAGDHIDFVVEDDGRVLVRAGTVHVSELKGLLHRPGRRTVSLEEMEDAILRHGEQRRRGTGRQVKIDRGAGRRSRKGR